MDSSTDGTTSTNTNTQGTTRENSFSNAVHRDSTISSDTTNTQSTSDSSAVTDGKTASKGGGTSDTKTKGDTTWSATLDGTILGRRLQEDGAQPTSASTLSSNTTASAPSTTSADLMHLRRLLTDGLPNTKLESSATRPSLIATAQFFKSLGARPDQQVLDMVSFTKPYAATTPATATSRSSTQISLGEAVHLGNRKLYGVAEFFGGIGKRFMDGGKDVIDGLKTAGEGILSG